MCRLYQTCLITLLFVQSSCAYRFTNSHARAPEGIRSIAIDGIFDTQPTTLPHEILWIEIQKQFAIDGRIRVASQKNADAYLRARIINANIFQANDLERTNLKYPKTFENSAGTAFKYAEFPNLKQPHTVMKNQNLIAEVLVEIWDLNHKVKLLEKVYRLDNSILILNDLIPLESQFINAEEQFELGFSAHSEGLAKTIVADFFRLHG